MSDETRTAEAARKRVEARRRARRLLMDSGFKRLWCHDGAATGGPTLEGWRGWRGMVILHVYGWHAIGGDGGVDIYHSAGIPPTWEGLAAWLKDPASMSAEERSRQGEVVANGGHSFCESCRQDSEDVRREGDMYLCHRCRALGFAG